MSRPNLFKCAPEWAQWAAVQPSGYVVFSDKPMVLNTKLGQWTSADGAQWLEQEYRTVDPSGWMFSRTPRDSEPEVDEQVYWIVLDSDGNRVGQFYETMCDAANDHSGCIENMLHDGYSFQQVSVVIKPITTVRANRNT